MRLYKALLEITKELTCFHMPGHCKGRIFEELGYDDFIKNIHKIDTTEILKTVNSL